MPGPFPQASFDTFLSRDGFSLFSSSAQKIFFYPGENKMWAVLLKEQEIVMRAANDSFSLFPCCTPDDFSISFSPVSHPLQKNMLKEEEANF